MRRVDGRSDPQVVVTTPDGVAIAAEADLRRVARLARTLVGAPVQVYAVNARAVRRLVAVPPDAAEAPADVVRTLATAEGSEPVTAQDGSHWFGAPIVLQSERQRAVLCARIADPGGEVRSAFADLASLAATAIRLEDSQNNVEALRELLGTASHDLRNPLTVLRAGLETLALHTEDIGPEAADRIAELAVRQSRRMTRMIDAMLALHGMEDGIAFEDVDLAEVVADVLESGRLAHQLVDMRLLGQLTPGRAVVRGIPDALNRLMTNLVTNAAVHGHGRVWVCLRVDDTHAEILVEDDGPGMPAHGPLDGGEREHRPGGHGLGLVIARRIVVTHGGEIDHERRDGGGTRVLVRLPIS